MGRNVTPSSTQGGRSFNTVTPSNRLRKTIFQVAYITTSDSEFPPRVSWLLTWLEDLQWLSFSFSPDLVGNFPDIVGYFMEPTRLLTTSSSFLSANIISLVFIFSVITLIVVIGILMHQQTKVPIWALRLLRWLFTLQMTALSIPIATLLLGGVHCTSAPSQFPNFTCFQMPHVIRFGFNILGLLVHIPILIVGALVFVETSPTSVSPLARAHSRLDVRNCCLVLLLVTLDVFKSDFGEPGLWIFMVICFLGLASNCSYIISTLPYYNLHTNMLRAGMSLAACLSMLACMILRAIYGHGHSPWAITMVTSSIAGLLIGALAAKRSSTKYIDQTVRTWYRVVRDERDSDMLPPIDSTNHKFSVRPVKSDLQIINESSENTTTNTIERRPSLFLNGKQFIHPSSVWFLGNRDTSTTTTNNSHALRVSTAFGSTMKINNEALNKLLNANSMDVLKAAKVRQPNKRTRVFRDPLQVECCVRFIRGNPTNEQIALGLQLLERGLLEFPKDSMLLLLAATYLNSYYGPQGEEAAKQLMKELTLNTHEIPMDVQFLIYCRERSTHEDGERHVLDRTELEALEREVRIHHLKALYAIREVWDLVRNMASSSSIAQVVGILSRHQLGASKCYMKILERNPRDKNALRSYANFLLHVEGDTNKANQIIELVEEMEFAQEFSDVPRRRGAQTSSHLRNSGSSLSFSSQIMIPPPVMQPEVVPPTPPQTSTSNFVENSELSIPSESSLRNKDKSRIRSLNFDEATKERLGSYDERINAMGSQAGSVTSGSSVNRVARQRAQMRRMASMSISRPLDRTLPFFMTLLIFILTVTGGFIICAQLFSNTGIIINEQLASARGARHSAVDIVEHIRGIVHGNIIGNSNLMHAEEGLLLTKIDDLSRKYLPVIASSEETVTPHQARFRLFSSNPSPDIVDYIALDPTSIEVTTLVLQAGHIAVTMNSDGTLTVEKFRNSTELSFLTDNLTSLISALRALPDTVINGYVRSSATYITIIYAFAGVSVGFPIALFFLAHDLILMPYFLGEMRILQLIRDVPKRKASDIVASIDEEIENFREIMGYDEGQDDDLNPRLTQPVKDSSTTQKKRGFTYKFASIGGLVILTALMLFMFLESLQVLNIEADMKRMIDSGDRSFFCSMLRIFSREFITPDITISKYDILRQLRGSLTDLEDLHEHLDHDMDGLIRLAPQLITAPRDCNGTDDCLDLVEEHDIGFTLGTASLPLNTEIVRLLDTGRLFISAVAETEGDTAPIGSFTYDKYRLLMALTQDVMNRLQVIDRALIGAFNDRLILISTIVIMSYVTFLLFSAFYSGSFVFLALRRLRDEARTLAIILYLIPPSIVKEMAELNEFLESGGAMLRVPKVSNRNHDIDDF